MIATAESNHSSTSGTLRQATPANRDSLLLNLDEGQFQSENRRALRFFRDRGEADQAVRIGLFEAVKAFRPERGIPFGAFARVIVRRRISKETRQTQSQLASVSLWAPEGMSAFEVMCEQADRDFERVEARALIDGVRSVLTETQNRFLDAFEAHDFNAAEAARSLGLTPSAGHKILARIRETAMAYVAQPIAA